jgi:hypothetical protein
MGRPPLRSDQPRSIHTTPSPAEVQERHSAAESISISNSQSRKYPIPKGEAGRAPCHFLGNWVLAGLDIEYSRPHTARNSSSSRMVSASSDPAGCHVTASDSTAGNAASGVHTSTQRRSGSTIQ